MITPPATPELTGVKASNARPLRIGLVGAGRISKFHFLAWQAVDGVEIVAICDKDVSRAKKMAGQFSIAKTYQSIVDLLDNEQIDALDIVTPPDSHAEILLLAATRGVDCLCQKPLSLDFDEATRLVAEVTPRIRLMVNENRRYLPYIRKARDWIAEGLIGEVQQVTMTAFRSSYLPAPSGTYSGTPALVSGPRLYVGGALIHQIDSLRSLLGPLHVIAARMLHTEADLEGDTLCTIFMETPAGAPVVISGNGVAVGYPSSFNDQFDVLGSRASIVWKNDVLRLLGAQPRDVRFDTEAQYNEMYQSCFTTAALAFRDAIQNGTTFETDARDNLETLKIAEDAYQLSRAASERAN